jgi:hypothetical protein
VASVFLVGQASNCRFQNVGFYGSTSDLTSDVGDTVGIDFTSTASYVCEQIVFDGCNFSGTTWASYSDEQLKGIVFSNSKLDNLYSGFEFGSVAPTDATGPTGVRINNNVFDNIYAEGIIFGTYSNLNASANNVFYNVGNHFTGSTGTPATSIIVFNNSNNISISDLFERSDANAATYPRIYLDLATASQPTTNGSQIVLATGTYVRQSGSQTELANGDTNTVTTISTIQATAFAINYNIVRGLLYRSGTLTVSSNPTGGNPTWSDDYVQNNDTGITLSITQTGTTITITYTATEIPPGLNGTINYSINYLA